jgi:uncharacterized protein
MSKPSALFYDFFQTLRGRGWELGWEQYELFLRGFILSKFESKEQLLNFCKTVWLSKPERKEEFEQLFENYYNQVPKQFLIEQKETTVINAPTGAGKTETTPSTAKELQSNSNSTLSNTSQSTTTTPELSNETIEISLNIDNSSEGNVTEEVTQIPSSKEVTFLFSEQKHLPFTVRKVAQTVRKLRVPTERHPTSTLDIPALTQQVAKEGMVSKLVYQYKNVGVQRVIWLSDHGGSMLPFESWEKQLLAIVKDTPNIQQTEQYFFHDYPSQDGSDFRFFTNRTHTEVKTLSAILKTCNKQTAVFFFSDGGAARRRFDTERLPIFLALINVLKNTTQRLVWLNPVKNTGGTVADYLSFLMPVRYPSNEDLKRLILSL